MANEYEVFDFHRIFIGNNSPLFLLEVVFRTLILYAYCLILLRFLGKRGMGQLSTLEVAIIIAFGSAIGDPMIDGGIPVTYGIVSVTVISVSQIWLERVINRNKKVEAIMEGEPRLMVDDGVIKWHCMLNENLSKEDLFRFLRDKEVEHLGQVRKALFEISGSVSVIFHPPKNVKPGLTVLPENTIPAEAFLNKGQPVPEEAFFSCNKCGHTKKFKNRELLSSCNICYTDEWIKSVR